MFTYEKGSSGLPANIERLFQKAYQEHVFDNKKKTVQNPQFLELLKQMRDLSSKGENYTFLEYNPPISVDQEEEEEKKSKKASRVRRWNVPDIDLFTDSSLSQLPDVIDFNSAYQYMKNYLLDKGEMIEYYGTVKVPGIDCAFLEKNDAIQLMTFGNAGCDKKAHELFSDFYEKNKDSVKNLLKNCKKHKSALAVVVYGKCFGGGINTNNPLSHIPRSFMVYAVKKFFSKSSTEFLLPHELKIISRNTKNIYSSFDFDNCKLVIKNYDEIDSGLEKIIEFNKIVEASCPVSRKFKIANYGIGVVWTHYPVEHNTFLPVFQTKSEYFSYLNGTKYNKKSRLLSYYEYYFQKRKVNDFIKDHDIHKKIHKIIENNKQMILEEMQKTAISDIIKYKNDIIKDKELDSNILANEINNYFDFILNNNLLGIDI